MTNRHLGSLSPFLGFRWLCLLLALCCFARLAVADDLAEAKRRFEAGSKAYELGEYSRAIDEYTKSYELSRKPLLLFDLGQCYRKLGDNAKALHFYRQYVEAAPTGRFRNEADGQIVELEALLVREEKVKSAPPNGVASEPERATPAASQTPAAATTQVAEPAAVTYRSPWYRSAAGWVLVGAGVGLAGAGGGVIGQSVAYENEAGSADTLSARRSAHEQIVPWRIGGAVTLGVGVALIVSGAVVFGVKSRHHETRVSERPRAFHLAQLGYGQGDR